MAIDRIRGMQRGGSPSEASPVRRAGEPFAIQRASAVVQASPASAASASAEASPLARLRRGEIDLDTYKSAKVEEALAPLGALHPSERDLVRAHLRAAIDEDGTLAHLIEQCPASSRRPL